MTIPSKRARTKPSHKHNIYSTPFSIISSCWASHKLQDAAAIALPSRQRRHWEIRRSTWSASELGSGDKTNAPNFCTEALYSILHAPSSQMVQYHNVVYILVEKLWRVLPGIPQHVHIHGASELEKQQDCWLHRTASRTAKYVVQGESGDFLVTWEWRALAAVHQHGAFVVVVVVWVMDVEGIQDFGRNITRGSLEFRVMSRNVPKCFFFLD